MGDDGFQDPLALESQVCFALSLASRSVIAAYKPVLEPLRLTHPQYLVMLALWEREPLSIKDLSLLLHHEPGTLSPLVKRLETIGYVERGRDARDERSLAIMLTEKGRTLRNEAAQIPGIMMRKFGMDAQELKALHTGMLKVVQAARAADDPAP